MKGKLVLPVVLLTLLLVGVVRAQTGGNYDLSWNVVSAGGGQSSSGDFRLEGTAGQAAPGLSSGGNYKLGVGFWWGTVYGEKERKLCYLPIVMKGYCSCGPDSYEPNDSCEQAHGPLSSGKTYQSWISCCDVATYKKSDYFYIDISTTNAINIYLTNIPAGADYDLYLYKSPGDDPHNPADESEGTGSSETISYSPSTTGRYYIRVYGCAGYSTSPYSLRVTYN